jgi:hypothetical protein
MGHQDLCSHFRFVGNIDIFILINHQEDSRNVKSSKNIQKGRSKQRT